MGCVPHRKKLGKDGILVSTSPNQKTQANNNNGLNEVNSENIKIERGMFVQGFKGNPYEKYEVMTQLGEGSYGKVLKIKEKDSEIFRAMKIIKKRPNYKKPEEEKRIQKEIHILRKLDHPNIIKVFEFYNNDREFFIISELCEGGELFDRIIKLKKFTEKLAADVMKQILSAVLFCHKNHIIHRDLKPENILIEANTTENPPEEEDFFTIKVIDFGTAEIFKKDSLLSKQIGTPYYIAPEVLNNLYNEKCDMWSCGVTMYILLCGCPPFYGRNDQEIYAAIKSGKFSFRQKIWDSVTQEAKNLIKKLLELDFNKRPTAEQAIKDPWFALFDDTDEDYRHKTSTNENYNMNENNKKNIYVKNSNEVKNFNFNNKINSKNINGIKSEENGSANGNKDFKKLYTNKIEDMNSNLNASSSSSYRNKNNINNNNNVLNASAPQKQKSILNNEIILSNNNINNHHNYKNNKNAKGETKNNLGVIPMKVKKDSSITELGLHDALTNLKNFRAERKLQLATLYFMVHTLITKDDVKLIRELFNLFDTDRDGRLTKQEILQGVKSAKCLDFSETEIQKLMSLVDIDGNGYIEYQEFIAATYNKKKILTEFNLKKAFELFDKDKSGKISSDELKSVLGVCNEDNDVVWEKIISEIDSDGDGEISLDEFKTMMYNLVSSA